MTAYKLKVIVEDDLGTELYWFYPLGANTTVKWGQTVHLDVKIGLEEQ